MNCSENTRTATQRAKQNLWFRRMFSVALLIGVLIGFLFAKVPIWFSTPEPTTTAVLYGAYTGQAVKVQSDGTIVQAGDFTPLNVPMDESLQEYVYWMADAYEVDFTFLMALIRNESNFQADVISTTNDYGLMQINQKNHEWLSNAVGVTDFLDPYQNIQAGIYILGTLFEKYDDPHKVLMAYNMGESGASNACVGDVFDIWQRTADQRSAQMVFCDLSTPGKNRPIEMVPNEQGGYEMAEFQNVYDDLRNKLIARGIPAEEIAYIHSANTETQKKELFGKVRSGQVRVLIGSTQKMGAGTNVQKKLVALHHLDCPWRPSDLQQREGRIIRQGNENNEVDIYTYVTENTFDSYLYQLVEGKQKFIGQIMTSKSPVRSCEDIDETALSYAEIKALCTGNPHIKEKMDLDIDVQRLRLLKANHLSQRYALEDQIIKTLPQQIAKYEQSIEGYLSDMDRLKENTHPNEDGFSPMEVEGTVYTDKKAAGSAILAACKAMTSPEPVPLGQYRGFSMDLSFASLTREFKVTLKGALYYTTNLGTDVFGNILRLDNLLESMEERISTCREQLENTRMQLENAKLEVDKPFPQEDELKRKSARLDELNILLNMDKRESEIVDGDVGDEVTAPARGSPDRER